MLQHHQAFKSYDEAGSTRRVQCLKYLVLANMLMESEVDPFNAQEAKPYKNHPEVAAMTNLVDAYQRNDIGEFEKILKNNKKTIMDDPFIRNYIEDLLRKIRTLVRRPARTTAHACIWADVILLLS